MARSTSLTALVAISCLAAATLATAGSVDDAAAIKPPRGVDPADAAAYTLRATFTCDGGATVIDASRINDEYCDCRDGRDEPGARACPLSVRVSPRPFRFFRFL